MPSADELRCLFSKECVIEDFIASATREIEFAAKIGNKYESVKVPDTLTMKEGETILKETFKDCKITWELFSRFYRISWKLA
jgi:hypothetical protein